jgi:hypothetical protein
VTACTDGRLPMSTEGQMAQDESCAIAAIVPREVPRMSFAAGTRAAAAKGVDRLARLTPTSWSFSLYM